MKGTYAPITTPFAGNGYSDGGFFSAAGSADQPAIGGVGTVRSIVKDGVNGLFILDISSDGDSAPDSSLLISVTVTNLLGASPNAVYVFEIADATITEPDTQTTRLAWATSVPAYQASDSFTFTSVRAPVGVEFEGVMHFPYLDLGALGREKQFVGLDLVADAPLGVTVSIGYDQRDLTKRTAAFAMDGDSLPAQMVPIPVSGPSFDLKIVFPANQLWEWQASCLYIQDWRLPS